MAGWGSGNLDGFIPLRHSTIYPAINPATTILPQNYTVCIIGATGVIGAGIAHAYTHAGASNLILASRRTTLLEEVAVQCKAINPAIQTAVVECDISASSSFHTLVQVIHAQFGGKLDAVVVNSGYSGPVVLDVTLDDPETVRKVTEVNYLGTYYAAHHLIPFLLAPSTTSTSTTTTTPTRTRPFFVVGSNASFIVRGSIANTQYCVSKLAQLKLIEHLHEQYSDKGVLAAAIHPGAVMTEMAERTAPEEFMRFLVDDPGLCGGFCVWLGGEGGGDRMWLGGRHLVAKWDVDELVRRKDEIVDKDLLKARVAL